MSCVIGVGGQKQNGKDTLADYLHAQLNGHEGGWHRASFALKLKELFCDTFDVDMEFVEKWKNVPEPPPGFDMCVRESLQFIGDGFRKIKGNIWLELAFRDDRSKIISDVRYRNEASKVKDEGGLNILVCKPDRINDDSNGSEAELRPYIDWFVENFPEEDYSHVFTDYFPGLLPTGPEGIGNFDIFVYNNGTIEDLHLKAKDQIIPFITSFDFKNKQEQ